ncbi:hypothetical protein CDD83_4961 [Cordyceps sp. RAO-2017]|nr:hypothetical protein CDD83_4961 [Cordyceps sp. RAO-2017]
MTDDENHRRIRRIAAPGFSERSVVLQEDCLQRYTSLFVGRLQRESAREGEIDFVYWVNALTTDIIGELAFGHSFGGLESGEIHPWLSTVFGGIKFGYVVGELRRLPRWAANLAIMCMPNKGRKHDSRARQYGAEAVRRRMDMGTQKPDLFSSLLSNKEQGNMSESEVVEAAVAFVIAGSETTATLLSACLYLLCRDRAIMRRITGMIRSAFAASSDLTLLKLQNHEYLNAVLQEALRLYPPAPDSLFRRTQKAAVVAGEMVPANTSLTMNLWAANRSSSNFHRPDDFVPERWLKDCPPEFWSDDRAVAKPFSFGPRDCLGKALAWAEMRLILANVLWHLDPELLPESHNWIEESKVYFLWEKPPLKMKFRPRQWE